ncbi:MAG TPA: hypothetical protein VF583_05175 [Bradyrhizobium sp.]
MQSSTTFDPREAKSVIYKSLIYKSVIHKAAIFSKIFRVALVGIIAPSRTPGFWDDCPR